MGNGWLIVKTQNRKAAINIRDIRLIIASACIDHFVLHIFYDSGKDNSIYFVSEKEMDEAFSILINELGEE